MRRVVIRPPYVSSILRISVVPLATGKGSDARRGGPKAPSPLLLCLLLTGAYLCRQTSDGRRRRVDGVVEGECVVGASEHIRDHLRVTSGTRRTLEDED